MKKSEYYAVLGVLPDSSIAEVKTAFRKKAKILHPDVNTSLAAEQKEKAEAEMRRLLYAYQNILKEKNENTPSSDEFDYFTQKSQAENFDYRLWLLKRSDYESRAKLIFFDLFHGLESEAVKEYNARRSEAGGFYLSKYFNREDFMDCGFVLAEELYLRGEYYEAFLLFEEIFYLEKAKPYFKHFFPEVMILINSIIRNKLHRYVEDDLAIDCYEAALKFGLKNSDNAAIHRKLADAYGRLGDTYKADINFREAVRLSPKLAGNRVSSKKNAGSALSASE